MSNYILDTNILVGLIRDRELQKQFHRRYPFTDNHIICTVTEGELRSLAIQWKWGKQKLAVMDQTLQNYLAHPIRVKSILHAYAKIDAYSQGKLMTQPLPYGMSARNMSKNDIWIAATAHVTNSTLLTADKDFDHLYPHFIELEYVDFTKS